MLSFVLALPFLTLRAVRSAQQTARGLQTFEQGSAHCYFAKYAFHLSLTHAVVIFS